MTNWSIKFSASDNDLSTNEEYFYLSTAAQLERRFSIHDYSDIYQIPGLYEYVVCDTLNYQAPQIITKLLMEQVHQDNLTANDLQVLDVGAGNGLSGKTLADAGVTSIVGLDIIPEAAIANQRDYPGVYQKYYVEDLTSLSKKTHQELMSQQFNVLLLSGSLYHLPTTAFDNALSFLTIGGWFVVTLRQAAREQNKLNSAYHLFEQLVQKQSLEIMVEQTYQQRLSVRGEPIMGQAIVAKKLTEISSQKTLEAT